MVLGKSNVSTMSNDALGIATMSLDADEEVQPVATKMVELGSVEETTSATKKATRTAKSKTTKRKVVK